MKLINKILKLSFFTTLIFLSISCEKDTLQEEVTNQETTTGKPLPNIKVNELTFTKESKVIQTLRTSAQSKFKTYRTNGVVEHNIVELPVGEINLDHGVELIDEQNRKNITFEVKEHNNDPNVFYNFMVINENEFWLYKIEKTLVTQNNIPAGSTIVSRQPLNAELNPSDPCPNITVFPPFGYETPENILTGGAGGVSIGSINNPNNGTNDGGFFNSGNFLGGITGGGYLGSQGGSSGTSGSSSSGGNNSTTGNGNGFSLSDITDPIVNGVTSAWNWIKNWFKGGCNTCPRRTTGGDGNSVQTNDIVVDIQDDCGSSTIYIIVQDAYVDKIISFEQYITYLHNNDRIFLYNNQYIVDYLETLIQQHNTNQNLMNILPDLISKTRNGIITWEFAQELIDFISQNPSYYFILNYLNYEEWSQETIEFVNYAFSVLNENENANPFLGADCRSFEYAQPPGANKKGCAVTNFNHTFYAAGVFPNGSPYYGEIESNIPIIYFTMPSFMTNGRAANLTAKAVTYAIKATDLYFAENPTVSATVLGNRLTHYLGLVGGTVNTSTPPFSIPSPAPYITSVLGISNPFDCE